MSRRPRRLQPATTGPEGAINEAAREHVFVPPHKAPEFCGIFGAFGRMIHRTDARIDRLDDEMGSRMDEFALHTAKLITTR